MVIINRKNPLEWERWAWKGPVHALLLPSKASVSFCVNNPPTMTYANQTPCLQYDATNKRGRTYGWWPRLGKSLRTIYKWGGWVINHTNWNWINRMWLWRVILRNGTDLTIWGIAEELSFRIFHCAWNRAIHQAGHSQLRDAQLPFQNGVLDQRKTRWPEMKEKSFAAYRMLHEDVKLRRLTLQWSRYLWSKPDFHDPLIFMMIIRRWDRKSVV